MTRRGPTIQPNTEAARVVRRALLEMIALVREDPELVDPRLGIAVPTEALLERAAHEEAEAIRVLLNAAHSRCLAAARIIAAPARPETLYGGWPGNPAPEAPTGLTLRDALPGEEEV